MRFLEALSTPRTEDCPSDFVLSKYETEALSELERRGIDAHVRACARCQAWLTGGRSAFEALGETKINEIVSTMTARSIRTSRAHALGPAISMIIAAAATMLLFQGNPSMIRSDTTRKGKAVSLRVYRERDGNVRKAVNGEDFHARDKLRFAVDVPEPGHVMIVGIEAKGAMYHCVPSEKDVSVALPAGQDQLLSDAIELDESVGKEMLHLIFCPQKFGYDDLEHESPHPRMPGAQCQTVAFELNKSSK